MAELKRLFAQVDQKLREPGLISSVAAAVEDNTGLPRMVLVYVLMAVTGLWLVFGYGAGLLCNSLAFVYPAYMSIKAIESTNKGDDTQWLTYWTVFSTFSVMEFFSDILVGWLPFYWLSKCIFMVWCMAPIQSNGSMIVYNNLILPFFVKHEKEITAIFTEATETVGEIASEVFNDASGTALANGANDVMVVRRKDGSLVSTPWKAHVGKIHSLLKSRKGKLVTLIVNDVPARTKMSMCESGGLIIGRQDSQNNMTDWELQELDLHPGPNKAKYVVEDIDVILDFNVFLYNDHDKLVITDIDGTITESDIKGQVLPQFGIPAQHKAVVELLEKISRNGYHLVYLTARSMSQDEDTRSYLFSMLQNQSGFSLPPAPVIFSPVTFLTGFISEVVSKTPHIEKSKFIDEMNSIFIGDFIMGAYGNKDTDTKAYHNSGIPLEKIWIVNPAGILRNEGTQEVTSYAEQAKHVHKLYPKCEIQN